MTNFANDLIRYLETTDSEDHGSLAKAFMCEDADWLKPETISEWRENSPDAAAFYSWKNMNVSFTFVDSYGGEGRGDEYWSVYKFTDNNTGEEVYVKFDGWYQSYNGAEYENCFVVQPKEKTVVVYE